MQRKTGILGILIAIVIIGIGYAVISAVPLVINGTGTISADQDSFVVKYTACQNTSASTGVTATCEVDSTDPTKATFTVTGMKKKDDTATFTFTIANESPDLSASIGQGSTFISNNNTEYFTITPGSFADTTVAAGATTTQTVTVTAAKTPIVDDATGTFVITLSATPVQP